MKFNYCLSFKSDNNMDYNDYSYRYLFILYIFKIELFTDLLIMLIINVLL